MPKSRYNEIYQTLKERIETGDYPFRELIPSENTLVQEFDCSRNTLRRAVRHFQRRAMCNPCRAGACG